MAEPKRNLNSNMDRFKYKIQNQSKNNKQHLNSNMDRFKYSALLLLNVRLYYLNSNMDRFKCPPAVQATHPTTI